MTMAEMRAAIELSRAAGHSKVPVPRKVLSRLLDRIARQSRGLASPGRKRDEAANEQSKVDRSATRINIGQCADNAACSKRRRHARID